MASLADELAADLDFSDSGDESQSRHEDDNDYMETEEADLGKNDQQDDSVKDIGSVAKLLHSERTTNILKKIDFFKNKEHQGGSGGDVHDEEYDLTAEANVLAVEMNDEINVVHKYIRDQYAARFPELEGLVHDPLDYARTVKAIGTTTDISKVDLLPVLPAAVVMVITLTGTTTSGRPLSPAEWKRTEEACDMEIKLYAERKKIVNYVESRMTLTAPNLTAIVGSSTAAKLITAAGGLKNLCKIPASNLQVVGNTRKTETGYSKATMERHTGYIYYSDIVNSVPHDYKQKVSKIVANKCAMAARFDYQKINTSESNVQRLRDEIDKKIEKLLEPLPSKNTKALPTPDEAPKKRRGGRRARKQKEVYAMTDLRAARNRMAFGEAEEEVAFGDESEGLGMAAKQIGKIRAAAADSRSKVKAPKIKSFSSSDATSGLATTLKFSASDHIELVDPTAAAARASNANAKYFGDGAFSIIKK